MNATETTASPVKVPMGTARRTGARFLTPSGLGYLSEIPPGTGSCRSRGVTSNPVRVRPAIRNPAAATGRQRGDGSFPVGKSRNMKAMRNTAREKLHSDSVPASLPAGSVPGWVATPVTA